MKWYKNKIVWASPLIALAIIFVFSVTALPTVQPTPKDLPIAVVNSDEGFQAPGQEPMNSGKMIMENVRKQTGVSLLGPGR